MKVDILSDLHLDFYFKPHLTTAENVASFFELIFTDHKTRKIGDVLIIAGDIGHYNKQNIEVLKTLQKEFYKHIICVLGNHDYYLIGSESKYTFENNVLNHALLETHLNSKACQVQHLIIHDQLHFYLF